MLIRFLVSNFLSFHDEIEFSMIPGKTRSLPNHVVKGENRYDLDILRGAVIYGPNASGKSNLIKAIDFARNMILVGTSGQEAIARQAFKLTRTSMEQPSKFVFEFKSADRAYGYGFELDARRIHSEWLYEIKRTTETMLFERTSTPSGETSVEFGKLPVKNKKEMEFLQYVAMGTRTNQLFLRESIDRNVKFFEAAYKWFDEKLVIVFPSSKFLRLGAIGRDHQLSKTIVQYLEQFGTGICGFGLVETNPEQVFPKEMISEMLKKMQKDPITLTVLNSDGERFIVEISPDAEVKAHKLMLKHKMGDCDEETLLEMHEESDGTQRLLDLLPFLTFAQGDKVFIVDELDRSLHPKLSRQFVSAFLQHENHSQLIVTTHESSLLDFDLLRRDEVWFIEKDQNGASSVYSLEEYTPRYDKDIEKGYLLGRFGAIPVLSHSALS
ncbi:MAG: ATP-binding protein [Anaerolineales bacterium]|nr:ATP-binding protein [Anaerolineales bacterium]